MCAESENLNGWRWVMVVGKKRYKTDQQHELAPSKREVPGPSAPEIQPFRCFLLLTKLDT